MTTVMSEPLPYLGWAWPKNTGYRLQHYFPPSGGGTLCGLWIEPDSDRDEYPSHPCHECRNRLARRVAEAVGSAT